jgi:hypothetical protein
MAMRAEHRKESLAHRKPSPTQAVTEHVGRFFKDMGGKPSTANIVFWVVLVLVVVAVVGWWRYSAWEKRNVSAEWYKLGTAANADDLQAIEKEYPGTVPALMARFQQARLSLRQGLEKYAAPDEKERTEARDKVKQGGDLYAQLVNDVGQYRSLTGNDSAGPLLRQEALRGAAKAYETLGDLEKAAGFYKQLADSKPETDVTKDAAAHLKTLQDNKAQLEKFYTAFNEQPGARAADTK